MFKLIKFLIIIFSFSANLYANELEKQLQSLGSRSSSEASIIVQNLSTKRIVYSKNGNLKLKPASTLKLLVSSYLLDSLGADFTYNTKLRYESLQNGVLKNLVIDGSGDPDFKTEDLWIILRNLKIKGVKVVENIYLNDTFFVEVTKRTGIKPYESGTSALSFNFNSIRFEICSTSPGSPARVSVDPWEYNVILEGKINTSSNKKVTYYVDELNYQKDITPQIYRLSGNIPANYGCVDVYRNVPDSTIYLGEVFQNQLKYLGIKVTGKIYRGDYTQSSKVIMTHESKPLSYIITNLNKYSNNFIAEQLLFLAGKDNDRRYSRQKGLINLANWLIKLGFKRDDFDLYDASGLSHNNRITAKVLAKIIDYKFSQDSGSYEFLSSLAVNQQTGTLIKRKNFSKGLVVRGKTGTINGVSSIAGVINSKKGSPYSFVILQNKANVSNARALEDKIINAIYNYD